MGIFRTLRSKSKTGELPIKQKIADVQELRRFKLGIAEDRKTPSDAAVRASARTGVSLASFPETRTTQKLRKAASGFGPFRRPGRKSRS